MRILFLNTNIGYGGATKIMMWLAEKLAEGGHMVSFLTFRDSAEYRYVPRGVNHIHLQLESEGRSISGLLKSIIRLNRFIRKGRFDIGIAFLSPSQLRLSLAAIGTPMKVLLSQRGDPYQAAKTESLEARLEHFAWHRADKYVFQTRQAMEYYDKSIQSRAVVIPNPVKPIHRTTQRVPDWRIVNIARLDIRQKRQDVLIEAFRLIESDYSNISLHFYGDGKDEATLRKLAKGDKRIIFEGVTTDVVEAVQNARIFVLSSDFEGIPNALIEAMSLGVPCISTKCSPGGAELLINNGQNGFLTARGDVKDLAASIKLLLDDPDLAERCGKEAMKVTETFSEDRIFNLWDNVIHQKNG